MTTLSPDLWDDDRPRDAVPPMLLVAAVVMLVIGIHIAGRVGAYCSPLQNDSYIYASFGYRIAHGDVLYRDMSDIKPPGLYMLFALPYLVLPAARSSIVPAESLFMLLAYYVIYRLARQMYGRGVALVVVVVAAVTINYFTVMGHVIEGFGLAENFMAFPAVAGVLFYRRGLVRRRVSLFIVAGVFLGFDVSIKQTALPVVAAVALHWSLWTLVMERSPRRWAGGCSWLLLGGLLAWLPFISLMVLQGTWRDAFTLLTSDAGAMIARGTAWPSQWREILPLQLPLLWCLWGALALVEQWQGARRSQCTPHERPAMSLNDLSLLLIWCIAELALLCVLPLRSAHYYVVTCIPFVLISGAPLAALSRTLGPLPRRVRVTAWSMAILGSAALYRPAIDAMVPCAIARYRAFDWERDQRCFNEAINWGRIHFGRGEPWVEPR